MKYKCNGQWNEMSVKVSDTLPIGTEVDYVGTKVPYGWEKIDDPYAYSINEVKTNKTWVDGKPIYRKVIDVTIKNAAVNHGIQNIENIINVSPIYKKPSGNIFTSNYYLNDNDFLTVFASISSYSCLVSDENSSLVLILDYTKTTDEGGNE